MAKSEKFEKATARARGSVNSEEQALALLNGETEGELQSFDPRMIAELVAQGTLEVAEQILELKEGMMITGVVHGTGASVKFEQVVQTPGGAITTVREVQTWRATLDSGARVTFLSSAQLDRMLPPMVGSRVIIARGGTKKTRKGYDLPQYFVAKYTDGKVQHEDLT